MSHRKLRCHSDPGGELLFFSFVFWLDCGGGCLHLQPFSLHLLEFQLRHFLHCCFSFRSFYREVISWVPGGGVSWSFLLFPLSSFLLSLSPSTTNTPLPPTDRKEMLSALYIPTHGTRYTTRLGDGRPATSHLVAGIQLHCDD